MIYISHRGNLIGKDEENENKPIYIENAIKNKVDVEIDIWIKNNKFYLGHDFPKYKINQEWIFKNSKKLWIHCKNVKALEWFSGLENKIINYFWHKDDEYTIVSNGKIWVHVEKKVIENSICVMPENGYTGNLKKCYGICSDKILEYKRKYE